MSSSKLCIVIPVINATSAVKLFNEVDNDKLVIPTKLFNSLFKLFIEVESKISCPSKLVIETPVEIPN